MKIQKMLVERQLEIGVCELERMVKAAGGFLIRISKTNKNWHVVYGVK